MELAAFAGTFPLVWLAALMLLGLIVGSFLNVVIHRLPPHVVATLAARGLPNPGDGRAEVRRALRSLLAAVFLSTLSSAAARQR